MELFKIRLVIHNNNSLVTSLKKLNEIVNNPTLRYLKMVLKRILAITFSCIILLISNQIFAQTEVDNNYQTAISSADEYFISEDYINAKASYQYACRLKPDEQYPKKRLEETIDRLREKMAVMEQYNSEILKADKHLRLKEYEQAKEKYEAALKILPEESYPVEKIAEIDSIISGLNEKQSGYNEAIKRGGQYIKYKKYDKAKLEFEKATAIYPEEQYPKDKISELDILIEKSANANKIYTEAIANADRLFNLKYYANAKEEYEKAADAKPDEDYPNSQIKEIDTILIKKNEFDKLVSEADELYIEKNLEDAKSKYQASLKIYPGESYPKGMIDKINASLNVTNIKPDEQFPVKNDHSSAKNELETATQKASQPEYNRIVAAGDRMFETKEYDKAKTRYNEALNILPNEQYPKDKLKEIEDKILAKKLAVQETYNNIIAEADAFFNKEQYEQAKLKYKDALKYKPEEQYPVQKITEIERLITDFETLRAKYLKLIADADKFFKAKEYSEAKPKYVEASALMPDEEYPVMKIEEINKTFKAEMLNIQQAYDKAIADADKFFSAKVYDQAIESYRIAKGTKPNETYPDQMINKILKILDENAVRDIVISPVAVADGVEKKFNFNPVSITDRKSNFILIKAKNTGNEDFKVVMGYGKGGSKNGGFILPVPAEQKTKEFIIYVGKQYKWFSEDNNWLSLTPQGGSVEVSLIKISKGN